MENGAKYHKEDTKYNSNNWSNDRPQPCLTSAENILTRRLPVFVSLCLFTSKDGPQLKFNLVEGSGNEQGEWRVEVMDGNDTLHNM